MLSPFTVVENDIISVWPVTSDCWDMYNHKLKHLRGKLKPQPEPRGWAGYVKGALVVTI